MACVGKHEVRQQLHRVPMQGARLLSARAVRREKRPFWWGILGGLVLAGYGVVATYQPPGLDFGRVYAAYGFVRCIFACVHLCPRPARRCPVRRPGSALDSVVRDSHNLGCRHGLWHPW
jgi:hypothetical protein